jgi:hypothetical protein
VLENIEAPVHNVTRNGGVGPRHRSLSAVRPYAAAGQRWPGGRGGCPRRRVGGVILFIGC